MSILYGDKLQSGRYYVGDDLGTNHENLGKAFTLSGNLTLAEYGDVTVFVTSTGILNISANISLNDDAMLSIFAMNGGKIVLEQGLALHSGPSSRIRIAALENFSRFTDWPFLPNAYDDSAKAALLEFLIPPSTIATTGIVNMGVARVSSSWIDFPDSYVHTGNDVVTCGLDDQELSKLDDFSKVGSFLANSMADPKIGNKDTYLSKIKSLEFSQGTMLARQYALIDTNELFSRYLWYLDGDSTVAAEPIPDLLPLNYSGPATTSRDYDTDYGLFSGLTPENKAKMQTVSIYSPSGSTSLTGLDSITGAFTFKYPNTPGTDRYIVRYLSKDGISYTDREVFFKSISPTVPSFKSGAHIDSLYNEQEVKLSKADFLEMVLNFLPNVDSLLSVSFDSTTTPGTISYNIVDEEFVFNARAIGLNTGGSYLMTVLVQRKQEFLDPGDPDGGIFSIAGEFNFVVATPLFPIVNPAFLTKTVVATSTTIYDQSSGLYVGVPSFPKSPAVITYPSLGTLSEVDTSSGSFKYESPRVASSTPAVVVCRFFGTDDSYVDRSLAISINAPEPLKESLIPFSTDIYPDKTLAFAPGFGLETSVTGFIFGSDTIQDISSQANAPVLTYDPAIGTKVDATARPIVMGRYDYTFNIKRGNDPLFPATANVTIIPTVPTSLDDKDLTLLIESGVSSLEIEITDAVNVFLNFLPADAYKAQHGVVTPLAGSTQKCVYTPSPGYFGVDYFTAYASQTGYADATCLVRIDVIEKNPIKGPDSIQLFAKQNTVASFKLDDFYSGFTIVEDKTPVSPLLDFNSTLGTFSYLGTVAETVTVNFKLYYTPLISRDIIVTITCRDSVAPAYPARVDYFCPNSKPYVVPVSLGLMRYALNISRFREENSGVCNGIGSFNISADGSFVFTPVGRQASGPCMFDAAYIDENGDPQLFELHMMVTPGVFPLCAPSEFDAYYGVTNTYPAPGVMLGDINVNSVLSVTPSPGSEALLIAPDGSMSFTPTPTMMEHGVYSFRYTCDGVDGGEDSSSVKFTLKGTPNIDKTAMVIFVVKKGESVTFSRDELIAKVPFSDNCDKFMIASGPLGGELTYFPGTDTFTFIDDGSSALPKKYSCGFSGSFDSTVNLTVQFVIQDGGGDFSRYIAADLYTGGVKTNTKYLFDQLVNTEVDETYPHDAVAGAPALAEFNIENTFGSFDLFLKDYHLVRLPTGQTLAYAKDRKSNKLYISSHNSTASWPIENVITLEGEVQFATVFSRLVAVFTTEGVYTLTSQNTSRYKFVLVDDVDILSAFYSVVQTPVGLFYLCENGIRLLSNSARITNPFLDVFSPVNPSNVNQLSSPVNFYDKSFANIRVRELLFLQGKFSCRWSDPANTVSIYKREDAGSSFSSSVQITPSTFQPTHALITTLGPPEEVKLTINFLDRAVEDIELLLNTGAPVPIRVPSFRAKLHFTITISEFTYPINSIKLASSLVEVLT